MTHASIPASKTSSKAVTSSAQTTIRSDPETGELWRITLAPNSTGRGAPFPVKASEVITVLHGVVDLELGGHPATLHEGDTLTTTTTAVTGWGNPGATECELLWVVLPPQARR